MTLSKELRNVLRKKLNIDSDRQLRRRIHQIAAESGIPNQDVAGLIMAHQLGITVDKPMYKVKRDSLQKLEECLARPNSSVQVVQQQVMTTSADGQRVRTRKVKMVKRVPKFLNFENSYPAVFYKRLEEEINQAAAYGNIPNAVF